MAPRAEASAQAAARTQRSHILEWFKSLSPQQRVQVWLARPAMRACAVRVPVRKRDAQLLRPRACPAPVRRSHSLTRSGHRRCSRWTMRRGCSPSGPWRAGLPPCAHVHASHTLAHTFSRSMLPASVGASASACSFHARPRRPPMLACTWARAVCVCARARAHVHFRTFCCGGTEPLVSAWHAV